MDEHTYWFHMTLIRLGRGAFSAWYDWLQKQRKRTQPPDSAESPVSEET